MLNNYITLQIEWIKFFIFFVYHLANKFIDLKLM